MTLLHGGLSLWASMRPADATVSPDSTSGAAAGPPTSPRPSLWRDARLAGLLGGAIGTTMGALSSLFFAMYFDAIGMPKNYFRATMSMAVVAIAFVRGLGYLAIGGYSRDVLLILAITVPVALIGIFALRCWWPISNGAPECARSGARSAFDRPPASVDDREATTPGKNAAGKSAARRNSARTVEFHS